MSKVPKLEATSWPQRKIGDLAAEVRYGSSSKTSEDDSGVPVLRMGNIVNGALDLEKLKYLPQDHDEFPKLLLEPGDVLFNRTNSAELVGKTAVYRGNPKPCSFASYLIRLRLAEGVPDWISYYLNSPHGRNWIKSVVSQQVGQANVNGTKLKNLEIPCPPLPEQRRIVARIEELFSRLDAGVAALRHAKAQLQRYRQSVLAAAVTGQLTQTWREQHPDTEPATELLERVLDQRRAAWTKKTKFKEPASVDQCALPELPKGWLWCTTDQLGQPTEQPVLTGPFGSNLGRDDFIPDGAVHVLTIGCLQQSGIELSKAVKITQEKADELERYKLQTGDLLFSRMASVGRAGFVTPDLAGSIFNYHIMRLRLSDAILPGLFVSYVQSSPVVTKYVRDVNHGATRDGINTQQLLLLPVPLAPVAEQHQIVAEVEARTTFIDHLEAELDRQITRSNRLRQSTLASAFSGELK